LSDTGGKVEEEVRALKEISCFHLPKKQKKSSIREMLDSLKNARMLMCPLCYEPKIIRPWIPGSYYDFDKHIDPKTLAPCTYGGKFIASMCTCKCGTPGMVIDNDSKIIQFHLDPTTEEEATCSYVGAKCKCQ
jgi:hypothetical protein